MARKAQELKFKELRSDKVSIYRSQGYFKFEPKMYEAEPKLPYAQYVTDWRGLILKEGKA